MAAFAAWSQLYANLHGMGTDGLHSKVKDLVSRILINDDRVLHQRSQKLSAIIGGRASVLPPDTRHVDYEVIPLVIADGCLYHCDFCCVKSAQQFKTRSRKQIVEQVQQLKDFYDRNLENYNALFLGNHDALGAGSDLICLAASEAVKAFDLREKSEKAPFLFLFGSVDSLLRSKNELFEKLSCLPFHTYINIGFESIDDPTLALIRKPISASKVREAFKIRHDINAAYRNIEVTGNFLIGETLPHEHYHSLAELLGDTSDPTNGKGPIYLSPIKDSPKKRELLPRFLEIKNQSEVPVYIYLIQRL